MTHKKRHPARNNLPNIPKMFPSRYLVPDLKHVVIFKIERKRGRREREKERESGVEWSSDLFHTLERRFLPRDIKEIKARSK